jgi:predicted Zn-dependent protease
MAKAELKATAALVALAMMVTGRASAQAQDDAVASADRSDTTIVLDVANYAALPPHVMDGARARVAKIYEAVGVHTMWVDSEEPGRQVQDGRLHLTIVLLSRDGQKKISADSADYVLGQAHLPSWRAYIYCDRIATLPGSMLFSIRVGNIIAHEVGHLVLRTRSHSRLGIMRADSDVNGVHLQNFDETQARTIQFTMAAATGR